MRLHPLPARYQCVLCLQWKPQEDPSAPACPTWCWNLTRPAAPRPELFQSNARVIVSVWREERWHSAIVLCNSQSMQIIWINSKNDHLNHFSAGASAKLLDLVWFKEWIRSFIQILKHVYWEKSHCILVLKPYKG